jgi:large-conductance mechanosensitive channel
MEKQNKDLYHKLFKYLIIAFIVFVSVKYIPENKVSVKENTMISAIASITFALLDIISPSIKSVK